MDLFQLTYFVEVAHKKSFTKASKSLHISQPSISKGIRTLEKNWNTTLFNRKGKTIELTETGLYLLPKVEIIVNDFTKINEQMESSRCLNSGNLSIGIPSMLSMFKPSYCSLGSIYESASSKRPYCPFAFSIAAAGSIPFFIASIIFPR